MTPKQKLFQQFPIDGSLFIHGEGVTTPYHVYNGTMLSLCGTVNGKVAFRFLETEHLKPVLDTDGRALAAVWICDFPDANLGAHQELQISLFSTQSKASPIKSNTFSYYRALAAFPDLMMVCHGLWNNKKRVVQYNSEHLRLNSKLAQSEITFSGDQCAFQFHDNFGKIIAEGSIPSIQSQSSKITWQIIRQMGLRGILRLLRTPYFKMPVVNTRQQNDTSNYVCMTYTACQNPLIRKATKEDKIIIESSVYNEFDFKIEFVQQLKDIGFIFLRPIQLHE